MAAKRERDVVEEMCKHPAFRGLWRSRCLERDGIYIGWSVTFILDREYVETRYCPDKEAACRTALGHLGEL